MPDAHIPPTPVPTNQADATLSQNNPTSAQYYTILAATANCRVITIAVRCTWTVQPTITVRITKDGVSMLSYLALPVSLTAYSVTHNQAFSDDQALGTEANTQYLTFLVEGRSITVEVKTTGGTVSNVSGRVKYAKW